jgi:hypothetical protein
MIKEVIIHDGGAYGYKGTHRGQVRVTEPDNHRSDEVSGEWCGPAWRLGSKASPVLHEKLAELAEHSYKRGVRRGHMECHKEFKANGSLSRRFQYSGKREFFAGQERSVRLTSKIKHKRRAC